MQEVLSDESVKEWFSWAGGSARACLKTNKEMPDGLAAWKNEVGVILGRATTEELLVKTWPCRSQTLGGTDASTFVVAATALMRVETWLFQDLCVKPQGHLWSSDIVPCRE